MNAQTGSKSGRLVLAAAAIVTAAGVLATAGCAAVAGGTSAAGQGTAQAVTSTGGSPPVLQLPSEASSDGTGSVGDGSTGTTSNGSNTSGDTAGGAQSAAPTPSRSLQAQPAVTVPAAPMPSASAAALDSLINLPSGVLDVPIAPVTPGPTGTIGNSKVPCLNGYVWRQAFAGDYVCVIPANHQQALEDNAAASSRHLPNSISCVKGYVWREVVPNDYVCVTTAVRLQVVADNAQANDRLAGLNLWASDYNPPSTGDTSKCSDGVCSIEEGGPTGPDLQINGDEFNSGLVLIEIRSNKTPGKLLYAVYEYSTPHAGLPGYIVVAQSPDMDCKPLKDTADSAYAIAYDTVSGRWSNQVPLNTGCVTF